MRNAVVERNTFETKIKIQLELDGKGTYDVKTGVPFFDHMLCLFAKHGLFDLDIKVDGDTEVDFHHTVEDTGIALGEAFAKAMGNKAGMRRYGTKILPMDEALILVSLDLSGRPFLAYDVEFLTEKTGDFDAQLTEEFLRGFAVAAGATLHVKKMAGVNTHHIIEGVFKALGKALDEATLIDERIQGIPSTKGML